jgi:hypothetical protein
MHLPVIPQHAPGSATPRVERSPQEVIAWAFARFSSRKLVVTTAFGM